MKIGRTSVSDRGSSNRNGFVTGEMNPSKTWSLLNHSVLLPSAPWHQSQNLPPNRLDVSCSLSCSVDRLVRNSPTESAAGAGAVRVGSTARAGTVPPDATGAPRPAARRGESGIGSGKLTGVTGPDVAGSVL